MYTENDLVRIAKRDNNTKRTYLVVNPLQGKHIPVKPAKALRLFAELAELVKQRYPGEKLLLIGFAETATAIGSALAVHLNSDYIQTTREIIGDVEYFFFSEAHSHATEQKLVQEDIAAAIKNNDRIVFVEDEVTTGNTILNIVRLLEAAYPGQIKYGVASLLNGMDGEALSRYEMLGISVVCLVKTIHDGYEAIAEQMIEDGVYYEADASQPAVVCQEYAAGCYQNARRLVNGAVYGAACECLWNQVQSMCLNEDETRILVLGTEEFMYPALYVAEKLEARGKEVFCHATTRSPITVSRAPEYPLHNRWQLASCYDKERTTFVYNLDHYDAVYLITDACAEAPEGLNTIVNALAAKGNTNIKRIRWCED